MARPLLLFAPGAGAPSTSPWMEAWAQRLGALGDGGDHSLEVGVRALRQRGETQEDIDNRIAKVIGAFLAGAGARNP